MATLCAWGCWQGLRVGQARGIQQALAYAEALKTPFVFASNGDGFVLHDRTGQSMERETHLSLEAFPGPEDLWRRYCARKQLTTDDQDQALEATEDDYQSPLPEHLRWRSWAADPEGITGEALLR